MVSTTEMTQQASPASNHAPVWRDLYIAALCESNRSKAERRIFEAEKAAVARVHELFYEAGDHIEEQEILDDVLYALRALKNSWSQRLQAPRYTTEESGWNGSEEA
jgi:hypothetical protein